MPKEEVPKRAFDRLVELQQEETQKLEEELAALPDEHRKEREKFIHGEHEEALRVSELVDLGFPLEQATQIEKILVSIVRLDIKEEDRRNDQQVDAFLEGFPLNRDRLRSLGFLDENKLRKPLKENIFVLDLRKLIPILAAEGKTEESRKAALSGERMGSRIGTPGGFEKLMEKFRTWQDVIAEMDKIGLRPANARELLEVAAVKDAYGENYCEVELGEIKNIDGKNLALATMWRAARIKGKSKYSVEEIDLDSSRFNEPDDPHAPHQHFSWYNFLAAKTETK